MYQLETRFARIICKEDNYTYASLARVTKAYMQVVLLVWHSNKNIDLWFLIGGIGWWPVAPTRHNQRRKLHHHKETTVVPSVCSREPLRGEPVSLVKSIASYSIMANSSNSSSTPSAVVAPSLNSYLSPYQAHNTKLHTLLHVIILSNNTCILPFYYASISSCTTCETHCRPGQPSVVGGEAGMAKHAPFMYSYIIVRI